MDYFSNDINMNLLKNHIMKDPLLDWYNIQDESDYQKDEESEYKRYILKESNKYKENLLRAIVKVSGLDIPLENSHKQTLKKIRNKEPLIIRGKMYDRELSLYSNCDIIVRYDYLKKIFPEIDNLPFHLLSKEYFLIHICYSTLHFRMDLKTIANDGITLYKKCNLYAFQKSLYQELNKKYPCFLLGKEYYYKKVLLPKQKFIGYIHFDKNIKDSFNNAYEWIILLRDQYKNMNIIPKPTHKELYPNMNHKESDWENEKMKLADMIKEITLVWNISYDERCEYLEKGIECWDDPKLLAQLKQNKKKDIQERMIHMNQQKDVLIHPRKNISNELTTIINYQNALYFDIESFLSFDEKQNLFTNEIKLDEPIIGIIGFIYNDRYYNFTIQKFTNESEKENIELFVDQLNRIKKNDMIPIYHWGHAEYNYIKYIQEKYPMINLPDFELINILDYFRTEPIIVQGVFKFGLKSIGSALYKNGLIKTTWGENDSGLDSMIKFKEICKNNNKKIPIQRFLEIKNIIEYNRIDCQVLYEIVQLLREKYIN